MTGGEREWAALSAAVAGISSGLCLRCPTTRWKLRWSETGHHWQLVVIHRPRCCVTRSPVHRRQADEFIHQLLIFHGWGVGHYGEEHLVRHVRLVVL